MDYRSRKSGASSDQSDHMHSTLDKGRLSKSLRGSHNMLVSSTKPARFNLQDVMGHFETDAQGNMIIINRNKGSTKSLERKKGKGSNDQLDLVDALGR